MLSQCRSESSSAYGRAGHTPPQKLRVQALPFPAQADDDGASDCSSSSSSLKEQKSARNGPTRHWKDLGGWHCIYRIKKEKQCPPWKKCKKVQLSPNFARWLVVVVIVGIPNYVTFRYPPFTDAPGICLVCPLGHPVLPGKSWKQQKQRSAK